MSAQPLYPLTFQPIFQDYLWGGRNLAQLGLTLPPGDGPIAECWAISAQPDGLTPIANGPLAGLTLTDAIARLGLDLLGQHSTAALATGEFPLLVKLLDCNAPLSVQVHPTAAYATHLSPPHAPKTEMWYILHAESDAQIIYGLNRPTTPAEFRDLLANPTGEFKDLLYHLPVQQGDAILVHSGSLHALLGGLIVLEIQQSSNTTYRVYDWDRVDAHGQPRPLHIDHALSVIDFAQVRPTAYQQQPLPGHPTHRELSRCDFFVVETLTLQPGETFTTDLDGRTFEIWGALSGQATVTYPAGEYHLPAMQFTLLPAALGPTTLTAAQPTHLVRAYVPAP